MKVPMLDLSEQYLSMREEILKRLDEVMASSRFILGENVVKLEQDLAAYSHVKHGVGVASGSDALHISLMACGVKEGDEVITTPFTFFATAGAIARCQAKPVFVDIDPVTFNIDADQIENKLTEKTKAIIPVHLYGQMADMEKINAIAQKHNLFVVEDAAQSIGSKVNGHAPGELGTTAIYSFFPTKNLGAYGDAGLIVTNQDDLAEKMKIIRVHGSKPKYYHRVMGYNSRLDEMQAAILNIKLSYLDEWNEKRRQHAKRYTSLLNEGMGEMVKTPVESEGYHHVFHQYTIRTKNRDELQRFLKENGISTMIYYPIPLHLQEVFSGLGYKEGDFPHAEQAAKEAISLPMFPELTPEQQQFIVDTMEKFYL